MHPTLGKIVALLPARGGSRGVPRKNIKLVNGKPLIAWTIDAALKSAYVDDVVISSDDDEIIQIAQALGCNIAIKRPSRLATDKSPTAQTVLHAIDALPNHQFMVVLQPTSPLRTFGDIDNAIEYMHSLDAKSCVSVREAKDSPFLMYQPTTAGCIEPVFKHSLTSNRRQDLPVTYMLNGAIYILESSLFLRDPRLVHEGTVAYRMPESRSLDIDTEDDLQEFERIGKHMLD